MRIYPTPKGLTSANQYSVDAYPHSGVFLDNTGMGAIVVSKRFNAAMYMSMNALEDAIGYEEPTKSELLESSSNINDILKVIAVTRDPNLIGKVLNGN